MNSIEALDRVTRGRRHSLASCPDKACTACAADRKALTLLDADALALWAVRVLDLYGRKHGRLAPAPRAKSSHFDNSGMFLIEFAEGVFIDEDAARLAAADDVKHELGDRCPRRPV